MKTKQHSMKALALITTLAMLLLPLNGLPALGGYPGLEGQIAYDIHQKQLLDHRYVLRWRGSCWSAVFQYHDYRIAPYQTRDYRISIDLTGLGTFLDIKGGLDSLSH